MLKYAAVAAIAVAIGATPALAQNKSSNGGLMAKLDANHDGSVSRGEYNAYRDGLFSQLDRNKDGSISKAEYVRSGKGKAAREAEFKRISRSGDRVTKADWDADIVRLFAARDKNNDGALARTEVSARVR